jgi:hypothetical protein
MANKTYTNDVTRYVAQELRDKCDEMDLSPEALSKLLGEGMASATLMRHTLSAQTPMTIELYVRICFVLKIDSTDLLLRAEEYSKRMEKQSQEKPIGIKLNQAPEDILEHIKNNHDLFVHEENDDDLKKE